MDAECFVVEVIKNSDSQIEFGEIPVISTADYLTISKECPALMAEINRQAVVICGRCRSFQVPSLELFRLREKIERQATRSEQSEDEEGILILYELLDSIVSNVVVDIEVTEAEWVSFLTTGKPHFEPLYDSNGHVIYTEGGNPTKLAYQYVVFKFGDKCTSCKRLYGCD